MNSPLSAATSPIEDILSDLRAGRMVVMVDDEDRENEGDLLMAAEHASADAINFMARFGRGLICLTLTREHCERLQLPPMTARNGDKKGTAFTVSIEAAEGVSTGISAADRARTVLAAVAPQARPEDLVQPGHIFPLQAVDGGVLMRAGHTEAGCDLAAIAGCAPAAVICEIMNDDGTMARLPDLIGFAQKHGIKVGTIADLIAHRRRTESVIERLQESTLESRHGGRFRMIVYVNKASYAEHVALVMGDISSDDPVLVRMHALNVLDDVLCDTSLGRGGELQAAMDLIGREGRGIVVLLREPHPTSLSDRVRARQSGQGRETGLRDYGVGAQILLDLGVRRMVLLSNTKRTIVGLDGYGLEIVEQRPIPHHEI